MLNSLDRSIHKKFHFRHCYFSWHILCSWLKSFIFWCYLKFRHIFTGEYSISTNFQAATLRILLQTSNEGQFNGHGELLTLSEISKFFSLANFDRSRKKKTSQWLFRLNELLVRNVDLKKKLYRQTKNLGQWYRFLWQPLD